MIFFLAAILWGINIVMVYALYKRKGNLLYLPSGVYVLFYFAVVIFSTLYHFFYPYEEKFNLFRLDRITSTQFIRTINYYLTMNILVALGIYIGSYIKKPKSFTIDFNSFRNKLNSISPQILTITSLILMVIVLILLYKDMGKLLFERESYIPKISHSLKTIYSNLMIVIALLAGILYRTNKFLAIVLILICCTIGLGLGSRAASLYLIVFLLPIILNKDNKVSFVLKLLPFLLLYFGLNISLRSNTRKHGLIPYAKNTINDPGRVLDYTFFNLYYTFVFGTYVTKKTVEYYKEPNLKNLATSVSPLPGKFTNWYEISNKLRYNKYVPFTSIGEAWKYPFFFYLFYFMLGFFLQYVDSYFEKWIIDNKLVVAFILWGLITLFTIYSFEYNFRSSMRMLYYAFIFILAVRFFSKIKPLKI